MPAKIFSAAMFGFECREVEVEVDILNGPASITIVGLGDASVQEAKERIRSAIKNSGAEYPRRKKTINLAPADLRKHGPMYDLPIALGLLVKSGQIPVQSLEKTVVFGELSLSGHLRRIPGVLPMVAHMKERGFEAAVVPSSNAQEASSVEGIRIIGANDLRSLVAHLRGETKIPVFSGVGFSPPAASTGLWHFEDIRGHEYVKRALSIAAAGGHNVLLIGPPGSGKTLLARSFQSILPPLTFEEALEVTKLYSLAGKLPPEIPLIHEPPFRALHHTATPFSLIGGGAIPRPGEISLAHHGILFLDELLQFPRQTLECLRQPLEDGTIQLTRVASSIIFPSQFTLLAATNPCICGYFGDPIKSCRCTPSMRTGYTQKLSGPLLDRIDIMVNVPRLPFEKISVLAGTETSEQIRKRVMAARRIQQNRYSRIISQPTGKAKLNGRISSKTVRESCRLDGEATKLLQEAFAKMHCSGRAYYRIIKVAQTIADLENAPEIRTAHLAEALQYRPRIEELTEEHYS